MLRRIAILVVLASVAVAAPGPTAQNRAGARAAPVPLPAPVGAPQPPRPNPFSDAWLAANHGKYDNIWTAEYESRLQQAAGSAVPGLFGGLRPAYGPDVRQSNPAFNTEQNEFQIDINPTNSQYAIGTSNDYMTAGVGIYRTSDGGQTWTAADASVYGVPAACCDPGVAYAYDGAVYAIILNTSPFVTYIIRSTDNGATWRAPTNVQTNDRPNIVVDNGVNSPRRGIVYLTYTDENASNRIKGYKSTDTGLTWSSSFFVGDVISSTGFEQGSQPRVASDGTLYVGYQQYNNINVGCAAGVQNVVARSTDGGATFTYTVLPVIQGGACVSSQNGRGIFCYTSGGAAFRSRSSPILGVKPSDPLRVYMIYSGGDLEPTGTYSCGGGIGNHSDILFRSSTDGGATFTAAQKINADPDGANKDQYYPWLAVTPNGTLWVGWHDRREDPNDFLHRWYQASSTDEGATWNESPVADVPSLPYNFIGDYAGLAATDSLVLPMWWDSRSKPAGDPYTDPGGPPPTATPTVTGTPPTATQTRTPTNTATPSPSPSNTATVVPPTSTTVAPTATATASNTPTPPTNTPLPLSPTATKTNTAVPPSGTPLPPSATPPVTNTPSPSATPCPLTFTDVHATDYFYTPVLYLACHGVVSGYSNGDGTFSFRPYNNTTRAQMVKIVVLGYGKAIVTPAGGNHTFADVLPSNPFFAVVETAGADNIVSGYNCGGPNEPCDSAHRPYFRPYANVTRGQLSKIDVVAAGWALRNPVIGSFEDVLPGTAFYQFVEAAYCQGVISGYSCGGPGEPCDGTNRPYFRQYNQATRGQIAKIVYLSVTGPASCGPAASVAP